MSSRSASPGPSGGLKRLCVTDTTTVLPSLVCMRGCAAWGVPALNVMGTCETMGGCMPKQARAAEHLPEAMRHLGEAQHRWYLIN